MSRSGRIPQVARQDAPPGAPTTTSGALRGTRTERRHSLRPAASATSSRSRGQSDPKFQEVAGPGDREAGTSQFWDSVGSGGGPDRPPGRDIDSWRRGHPGVRFELSSTAAGNQMFQYAAAKALAVERGCDLLIDTVTGFKDDPYGGATNWEPPPVRGAPSGCIREGRRSLASAHVPSHAELEAAARWAGCYYYRGSRRPPEIRRRGFRLLAKSGYFEKINVICGRVPRRGALRGGPPVVERRLGQPGVVSTFACATRVRRGEMVSPNCRSRPPGGPS
jgi:hypothetical protein